MEKEIKILYVWFGVVTKNDHNKGYSEKIYLLVQSPVRIETTSKETTLK